MHRCPYVRDTHRQFALKRRWTEETSAGRLALESAREVAAAATAAAVAAVAAADPKGVRDVAAAVTSMDSAMTRALDWMRDKVAGLTTPPFPAAATAAAAATRDLFDDVPWMFPLNTDGIDVGGRDIHIHDCDIENFDDAVAVKPSHGGANTQNVFEITEQSRIRS